MKFAVFALALAVFLFMAGCAGSDSAPKGSAAGQGQISGGPSVPTPVQPEPATGPVGVQAGNGTGTQGAAPPAPVPKPAYVDYCYPTYWEGNMSGIAHNSFYQDRCGEYDYLMGINVKFTMPFDLAAYLEGKDFNFMDCDGVPEAAKNGSGDISIDGSFKGYREITTQVTGIVDRRPDTTTSSQGPLYLSEGYGLSVATYPRKDAQAASQGKKAYPYLVVDRCTWENGISTTGFGHATLFGANWGNVTVSSNGRMVEGSWGVNGTVAGGYLLVRTD